MPTENESMPSFSDFKLNKQLLSAVKDLGYETPTPIQLKAIPLLLAGRDILGIAQTGTGKTAAFVLPMLMKIKYAQGDAPRGLILAPTRELVVQLAEQCALLAKYTDLRFVGLYGGLGPKPQIAELKKGVDIIISTPGRFLDLYRQGHILTKLIKTMVMDEADRMMDMGFMPQINAILEVVPAKKRQNALFSATMPERMLTLTEDFLEFPEKVEVTPQSTTVDTIDQYYYKVPNFLSKINLLGVLFKDEIYSRVIVFAKTKTNADNIAKFLFRKVSPATKVIHANKGQNYRLNSFDAFREGNIRFLVATDVAARGIDVSMVSHVINFDLPISQEDYVHRVGRTGRAHNEGVAISFCNAAEEYHFKKIEEMIGKEIKELPLPEGLEKPLTLFDERQDIAREVDRQKRKADPTFKGAFHLKKRVILAKEARKEGRKPAAGDFGKKRPSVAKKDKKDNKKTVSDEGAKTKRFDKRRTNK